ncbi:MAG: UDP-N-acetylmuramate dehydrogenase [Cyanobacteria bacterium P01_A01_bin.135]
MSSSLNHTFDAEGLAIVKNQRSTTTAAVGGQPMGTVLRDINLPQTSCQVRSGVLLSKLTSFQVGGAAELFVAPQTLDQLAEAVQWGKERGLPVTVLGAGTNLLISDRGLQGLVICLRRLRHSQIDPELAQVGATGGYPVARLAWQVAELGWAGFEWAAGIPGTVGGAVVMNAGAHRQATSDSLLSAQVLLPDSTLQQMSNEDLQFAYRTSVLQQQPGLVTYATFQLAPGGSPQQVTQTTKDFLHYRHTTQPYNLPNCGSVFRNPKGDKAGRLIEQAGLKGYQVGAAQVSLLHANFVVNLGGATAQNILEVITHVRDRVEDKWSVRLHREVKLLGEF